MATFQAIQATLTAGANAIESSMPKDVTNVDAVWKWLDRALCTYPEPAVKIMSTVFLMTAFVFLMALATNNFSWVDKSWSLLPVYYAYVIVSSQAVVHPRMAIIFGLISFWSTRLTFNFWRKGGYSWSGEDYRWKVIQNGFNPFLFQIFNLVFIAFIQNVLLASIVSPVYVAYKASYTPRGNLIAPLNEIDYVATALATLFLFIEAVADQQQWSFQTAKYKAINAGKRPTGVYAKGFLSTGLFKYSRHPNFFAEQAFWWSLCLFATAATGKEYGWWMAGAGALTALFQGSTWLTEKITAEKYPAYKDYQKSTSRLMPWFPAATGSKSTAAKKVATPTKKASPSPRRARKSVDAPAPAVVEEAVAVVAEAAAPAPSRGRSTTRRASAPAQKAAASRSRSASAKKATAKKAAAPAAAAKKAAAPAKSRSTAPKKTAAASTAKSSKSKSPAPRRSTRARA